MVHSCIVVGCPNKSSDSHLTGMSWHRVRKQIKQIRAVHPLPSNLDEKILDHYRICNHCLLQIKKPRKPPTERHMKDTMPSTLRRYTRSELRRAIAHDHSYSLPSPAIASSQLSKIVSNDYNLIPLVKPREPQTFCIELFKDNDDAISCYTGFSSYSLLLLFYEFLGTAVNHLNYHPSSSSSSQRITRRDHLLSPINEFFLTLCRLKRGLSEQDLAYRFKVSQSTVSRVITMWVNFTYRKFSEIQIWPSREQVSFFMPSVFKEHHPNTRVIIDATEVFIQRPSDPNSQQQTFSSYKNHNTAKVLIGITPSGAVSFVSKLYGGSISDRELFIQSGILEKLDVGDGIMADKGFNVADIVETKGMVLNIPPRKTSKQFTESEVLETRRIASLRIHVERAIGRIKNFHILHSLPNSLAGLATEIFHMCTFITMFQPPLVRED